MQSSRYKKTLHNPKIIAVLLLTSLLLVFASPYMFGALEDTTVNINTISTITLKAKVGQSETTLPVLGTIAVSSIETVLQDTQLRVYVKFNIGKVVPDGFEAILYRIGGADIETQTTYTNTVLGSAFTFEIDNAPQGLTLCAVRFTGSYENTDGTFKIVIGSSYSVFIDNPFVAQPNPVVISGVSDYTQEPFVSTTLHWTWQYSGTSQAKITEDTKVLETNSLAATSLPQTYSFLYTPTVSGNHAVSLTITPTDGSNNVAKTDTVMVHVLTGGEEQDFPPSADSIFVSMDAPIYPIGLVWDYGWGVDTSTPLFGLQEYAVSGTINIQVVANPKGSLSSVSIWVYEGNIVDGISHTEYQMETAFETSGLVDLWIGSINTETFDAGIHTVEIYGVDKADGHTYLLAQVNLAVRTLSVNGILIVVSMIGIVAVWKVIGFQTVTKRIRGKF